MFEKLSHYEVFKNKLIGKKTVGLFVILGTLWIFDFWLFNVEYRDFTYEIPLSKFLILIFVTIQVKIMSTMVLFDRFMWAGLFPIPYSYMKSVEIVKGKAVVIRLKSFPFIFAIESMIDRKDEFILSINGKIKSINANL